jgi:hypothetical protein
MYIQPTPYTHSIQSSNIVQTMHPPLSTTTSTIRLSQEHRTRLYQIINELNDEQLRLFLTNHLQSISNTTLNNQFQHHSRTQLIQQAYILIDNNYSVDLEQTLYAMRQKRFPTDYQQQQQQIYQSQQQQQQQNYSTSYNQQPYYYTPQAVQYNVQSNYRFPSPSNVSQQFRQSKYERIK